MVNFILMRVVLNPSLLSYFNSFFDNGSDAWFIARIFQGNNQTTLIGHSTVTVLEPGSWQTGSQFSSGLKKNAGVIR